MSKVEDEVCEIIQARAKKVQGTDKYNGATMEREDLTHDEWLEHLQQELMDAVIYIQRLRTREQTLEARLHEVIDEWCIDFDGGLKGKGHDEHATAINYWRQYFIAVLEELLKEAKE